MNVIVEGITILFIFQHDMKSIVIPSTITFIGIQAFDGTKWYDSQPKGLIYAGKIAYQYKGTMPSNTRIEIKEGTTCICGGAFSDCEGLTDIYIPCSVTEIGSGAFYHCVNLTKLIIPNSVKRIDPFAFYGCDNLEEVTFGNSVTIIGDCAFADCVSLKNIELPKSVKEIHEYAFEMGWSGRGYFEGPINIIIPENVVFIGNYAFGYCLPTDVYVLRTDPEKYNCMTCLGNDFAEHDYGIYNEFGYLVFATNYSILHVPTGCKEKYASIKPWCYFTNIVDDIEPTGIVNVSSDDESSARVVSYYNSKGQRIAQPQSGVNIVRYSDGTSRKILIK